VTALLPVAEAQARLLALAAPVEIQLAPIVEAAGRWAAASVIARRTQPFANLSAMDGYAIRFSELPGPWRVTTESKAGSLPPAPLDAGQAARIFTGAPVPPGADTVLVQEEAARSGNQLMLAGEGPKRIGQNIRPEGMDFKAGDILIQPGDLITAAHVGLAAAAGHASIEVRRPVRVALISTGDELIPVGSEGGPHQLPSSNAPMLRALLDGAGATVTDLGIASDRIERIVALIQQAADADIIITSGGASVGDHDLVKPAFEAAGAQLDFWRVAMRPGKPLMAGTLGQAIILGLPGNPLSAYVTACLFARPLIARLGGSAQPFAPVRRARLARPLPANGGRDHYIRGTWTEEGVIALEGQDSAALTNLVKAGLFIIRAAHAPAASPGDLVQIIDIA
jgi:molybdopterin molybdotransferase